MTQDFTADTAARIAIVGAGAAGLAAAWYLRKRGCRDITLFEKADRIGGKCWSFLHDGHLHELGAIVTTPTYRHVRALAKEVGAELHLMGAPVFHVGWHREQPQTMPLLAWMHDQASQVRWAIVFLRYFRARARYRGAFRRAGFAGMSAASRHPDLSLRFADWARANGVELLLLPFQLNIRDMGFGDAADLPAGYVLHYMDFGNVIASIAAITGRRWGLLQEPRRFRRGFGGLWDLVAAQFDVRLQAGIAAIRRAEDGVHISWAAGDGEPREDRFDLMIVACPPPMLGDALDATAEETALFEAVEFTHYVVTICDVSGMPADALYTIEPRGPGHPVMFRRPWPEQQVGMFYALAPETMPDETLLRYLREDSARIFPGSGIGEIIRVVRWPLFPHFPQPLFAQGYHDRLEALQGQRRTWYCGGLLGFEAVESVTRYSAALADRILARAQAQ